jgi:hypothetical protein
MEKPVYKTEKGSENIVSEELDISIKIYNAKGWQVLAVIDKTKLKQKEGAISMYALEQVQRSLYSVGNQLLDLTAIEAKHILTGTIQK